MGIHSASDQPLQGILVEGVRDLTGLLVVDNCEHVISAAAAIIEALLEAGRGLRVLATSREALRLPGEGSGTLRPWLHQPILRARTPRRWAPQTGSDCSWNGPSTPGAASRSG
jgi:hypothetical protein